MPWTVERSDSCPKSKPWAVIKDADGEVEGCHETEDAAKKQMAALYAQEKTAALQGAGHGLFTLKATTTVGTEQGTFEAVISTGAVDRDKDIVEPEAMVKALRKYVAVGKKVPLDWNHGKAAVDQIGHIDPASVKAVDREVVASGWIDRSTDAGAEAWRLVKSGTLGFSFYGLIPRSGVSKRAGGGLHVHELDVAAVTATPTPANNETRVLAWKSVDGDALVPVIEAAEPAPEVTVSASEAELAKQEQEQRLGEATKDVPKGTPVAPDPLETLSAQVATLTEQFAAFKDEVGKDLEDVKAAAEEPKRANTAGPDPLRKRSDQAVLEIQSDGISLRKSPTVRQEPARESASEAELKARARREMLELLTGVPYDQK